MQITVELYAGSDHGTPSKKHLQKNIDAMERVIAGRPLGGDYVLLMDTQSILAAIMKKLPND